MESALDSPLTAILKASPVPPSPHFCRSTVRINFLSPNIVFAVRCLFSFSTVLSVTSHLCVGRNLRLMSSTGRGTFGWLASPEVVTALLSHKCSCHSGRTCLRQSVSWRDAFVPLQPLFPDMWWFIGFVVYQCLLQTVWCENWLRKGREDASLDTILSLLLLRI